MSARCQYRIDLSAYASDDDYSKQARNTASNGIKNDPVQCMSIC